MAALTSGRRNDRYGHHALPDLLAIPLKGGIKVYKGAMMAITAAGILTNASADVTLKVVGSSEHDYDTTGLSDGDLVGQVRRGAFHYKNSAAGDAIAQAEYLKTVYVVDNQTVAKTDGTGTRPAAGIFLGFGSDGLLIVQHPVA
jgi:hypothetical protein